MQKKRPSELSSRALQVNRRNFLKVAGAAMVLPTILPSSVLGRGGAAPSGKVQMGVIGWGAQGPANAGSFLGNDDCKIVAACDVDKNNLRNAVNAINKHYDNTDCASYADFREMLDRPDLDAVMIAVPDHWHAVMATEAARRGIDVYGEKPLARTVAEQQAIVKAVQANKIIWQTGSWQRSQMSFRKAAEIVRNGLIGEVTRVEVGLPGGHGDSGASRRLREQLRALPDGVSNLARVTPGTAEAWKLAVSEPPADLDYEMWLGPAQMEPYIAARIHWNWRWNYNTGGGQLLDWISHHCDIAHWGMDWDNSGPLEVEGEGEFPPSDAIFNTAPRYRVELKYPKNVTMVIAGGHRDIRMGTKWIGTDGWVWVDRGGFDASNPDWKKGWSLPEELRKVKLYESRNHYRNFLDCVKSRQPTITPVEVAHHSAIPGHLGLIAMLTKRKIRWDAKTETIIDDGDASKLLSRNYRGSWKLA